MSAGAVRLELDGHELMQAPDPSVVVKEAALREIALRHHYDGGEMEIVENDELLSRSSEAVALKVREAARAREWRDAHVADKGRTPTAAPFRWRVKVHFTRPETRGAFDRKREG